MAGASKDTPRASERILAMARDLFHRQGARAVGVDEIVVRAGTTKPSLYRAFGSKDGLIAAYLETLAAEALALIETAAAAHPDDPKAQLLGCFDALCGSVDNRGCGLTNAVVEFPEADHPGRQAAVAHKDQVRKRLRDMARAMNARKPKKLADSLLLLIEGASVSRQIFGAEGPAEAARGAAEALIEAHTRGEPA